MVAPATPRQSVSVQLLEIENQVRACRSISPNQSFSFFLAVFVLPALGPRPDVHSKGSVPVSQDQSKKRGGQPVSITVLLMLAIIIAAGVFLRGQAFLGTEVVEPLQGDSAEAYALAQTLSAQGAYQVLSAPFSGSPDAATDETFSSLGYPLFLSLFADSKPATASGLSAIVITQLVLGALAILLVYLLTARLLDPHWGLTAALLTAVSPYLVNVSLYLVAGTVLMIAMLLYLTTAAKISERGALLRTFIASALLGVAALTDPTFEFLIVPWALLLFFSTKGSARLLTPLAAILGFALVFSPMIAQNQAVIDAPVASAPIVESIQQGMQPLSETNSAVAPGADADADLVASFEQLKQRFSEDPRAFLRWYFVDKTQAMWSWSEPLTAEDTLVYAVSKTPYADNPGFLASEEFMRILHGPIVLVGAFGALIVWLPFAGRRLSPAQRIGLRSVSLVLLYATLAHAFGIAAPQHATPLLPMLFVMALTPLYLITLQRPETAPAVKHEEAEAPQPEAA